MPRYSALSLIKHAITGNRDWPRAWPSPQPKSQYDVILVGGGGHGLSTAYYLAREFGIRKVAVLEKGYIGSGNAGRNTTIVRSNYMLPGATEVPNLRIHHFETPSPHTEFGAKGMGEGGAIAPPAAIFNAVNDALRTLGAEVMHTPLTPRRLLEAIEAAKLGENRKAA